MNREYIVLIVYIVGYIAAYYSIRWQVGGHDTWSDVWTSAGFALLSWITAVIAISIVISKKYADKKPPKWL